MNQQYLHPSRKPPGSALVITLVILVLVMVIVVGYISSVVFETKAARGVLNEQKTHEIATLGMHCAVAQLRDALGNGSQSWDNPYGNFMSTTGIASSPSFFWSISPGLLTRWEYAKANFSGGTPTYENLPAANKIPLFSGTSVSISGTLSPTVNLNRRKADGTYPIISGSTPVAVQWVNILNDPSSPAGQTNQITGRYAFWIDDENSKININTADGTNKADPSKSLGVGTPTEVSLQALSGSNGIPISRATAADIVEIARTTGFHSIREILRVAGTEPDLYANNVFNITISSRSPDLNIFGQPKIALIPAQSYNNGQPGALQLNYITMQPLREIYPTSQQLSAPKFNYLDVKRLISTGTMFVLSSTDMYPQVFPQAQSDRNDCEFVAAAYPYSGLRWLSPDTTILLLSDYLSGKNTAGSSVYTWPAFPGATAISFLQGGSSLQTGVSSGPGKYSARQIDSIVSQIYDISAKATSSDYYNPAPFSGVAGRNAYSAPTASLGFLSGQPVPGMGRTPKVTKLLLKYSTYGSLTTSGTSGTIYTPPKCEINTWMELWFPAHYQGVCMWNKSFNKSAEGLRVGAGTPWANYLNIYDKGYSEFLDPTYSALIAPQLWPEGPQAWPSVIPKSDGSYSYWGNQLLTNNQGIDFIGNPEIYPDPDQVLAGQNHPYLFSASSFGVIMSGSLPVQWSPPGYYLGSSPNPKGTNPTNPVVYAPLCMNGMASASTTDEWAPGEIRRPGSARVGVRYSMSPVAAGGNLTVGGGLTCMSFLARGGNSDPVPLESQFSQWFLGDQMSSLRPDPRVDYPVVNPGTANAWMKTLRDRLIKSVVPMNGTVPVPPDSDGGMTNNTLYIYSRVMADPLVNKFPGDWCTTTSSSNPTVLSGTQAYPNVAWESSSNPVCLPDPLSGWYDPDSYWMPTMDSALFQGDNPVIPRCARFPSIGYLQYLRTGMIPDDEDLPYSLDRNISAGDYSNHAVQHGASYRLLNFGPSYNPSDASMMAENPAQKTDNAKSYSYPDWAMFDLVYIPSMLLAYGSPYAPYAGQITKLNFSSGNYPISISYQNPAAANNMFLYGTFGGATSGRINPNGSVIYTTDVTTPATDDSGKLISRVVPLQALLRGLYVNQNLVGSGKGSYNWTNGKAVDEVAMAKAIAGYIQKNGPLRIPGEICNIPEVAALAPVPGNTDSGNSGPYPQPVNNPTRNDLVRQIIGNLTTQSNTFSVWVAGQSVQKSKSHLKYGEFEPGDRVLSEVRYHYIVERFLDPGADGIYGNLSQPGPDGIVGTLDDVGRYLDSPTNKQPNSTWQDHPPAPRYLYRVIYSEEVK